MNTLNRYIATEIFKGTVVSLVILVTLVNFFTFADELRSIGQGGYDFWAVAKYVLLTSPSVLYDLFPSAALIGTMFALGSMANNRELVAMRSAGVSVTRIIWAVLRAGLVLAIFSIINGELVAPAANRMAREFKATIKDNRVAFWSIYGFWTRDGRSFINIRRIEDRTKLGDITIYKFDFEKGLESIQHAENADYLDSEKRWLLSQVLNTRIDASRVTVERSPRNVWESVINPELLSVVVVNPGNLSIMGLDRYIRFLKENGQQSHKFELAFWQRAIDPLITLVMLLVAVPFVLNVSRSVTMGQRMMVGVVIGLLFILFDRMVGHLGLVYSFDPMIAAMLPGTLFFVLSLFMIKRMM
ncbi:MAG: LPS export ABC transporter permease LptG [Methylococcaceae bacterium]|nr:LPS export ABC transporter permease LptG [Methylococcaceae bacterium]MCI0732685.1 LPS export ABC transporter permease LptG [Methylococcaceae bacterium]